MAKILMYGSESGAGGAGLYVPARQLPGQADWAIARGHTRPHRTVSYGPAGMSTVMPSVFISSSVALRLTVPSGKS